MLLPTRALTTLTRQVQPLIENQVRQFSAQVAGNTKQTAQSAGTIVGMFIVGAAIGQELRPFERLKRAVISTFSGDS